MSDEAKRPLSRWTIFWTAFGAIGTLLGALIPIYLANSSEKPSPVSSAPPVVVSSIPQTEVPPPNDASKSSNPEDQFKHRITTEFVNNCGPAGWREGLQGASVTLACQINGLPEGARLVAGLFETESALDDYAQGIKDGFGQSSKGGCRTAAYAGSWKNLVGHTVGDLFCWEKSDGTAVMVWTFRNDAWIETHKKYFAIHVTSSDRAALYSWFTRIPV